MRGVALAFLLAVLVIACNPGPPGPGIDVDRAMTLVRELAVVRDADTPASSATVQRIVRALGQDGIEVEHMPVGRVDLPEITVLGALQRNAHAKVIDDPNLVVRFGPPGPALLVMAHYDSVATSPGAIDNAAAVAIVIELARVLSREPPSRAVILAFTAAEELGLVGAEALAAQLGDRVELAISLDLIGGAGELVVNGAGTLVGHAELSWLFDGARRAGVLLSVPLVHRVVSRWWPQAERSDHGAFTRRGIRAVHLYHRGHDGEWIDTAYHGSWDVPERVQRASVDEVGRLLRALIATPVPAPAPADDGFPVPWTRTVVPRIALVAVELVLVLVAVAMLLLSRDGLLAALTRSRERLRGAGLLAGLACYALAVILAIVVERFSLGQHVAGWWHAPGRALAASTCMIAGVLGLLTRGVARWLPWRGEGRYLAAGVVGLLVPGVAWLVVGAAELAWVWLVPAAALALAPRLGHVRIVAVAFALLPALAVLHPDRVREAAFNGFWPAFLPLAGTLGLLGLPFACALAWWLRRRGADGPLGTLVLALGWGLLVIVGIVMAAGSEPACTAAEFMGIGLACERV